MKIRTRILLVFSLLSGIGIYFLVDHIYKDLRNRYLEAMEESMVDTATLLSTFLEQSIEKEEIKTQLFQDVFNDANKKIFFAKIYALHKSKLEMKVYVTNNKGIVIFDSHNPKNLGKDYSQWNDVLNTLNGKYGARSTRTDPADPKTSILYVASAVKKNNRILGVVTVSKPAKSVSVFLDQARRNFIWSGVFTALVVLVVAWLLSLWMSRPIEKLTRYVEKMRDGRRAKFPELGSSEIASLGKSFEEMRVALDGKKYVENYIQTLTHEMKSPLSALQGAAELLSEDMALEEREKFIQNIMIETSRIQNMVDRLLQLVSVENRNQLEGAEDLRLADVVEDVLVSCAPALFAKEIEVIKKFDLLGECYGEYFLIRQAFANLMQNAIGFSPQKSEIILSLSGDTEMIYLSVQDEGLGVPSFAQEKIFTRFFSLPRPDVNKKSTGLGLAFVKEVALLHGGDVVLSSSSDEKTTFTLSLPKRINA